LVSHCPNEWFQRPRQPLPLLANSPPHWALAREPCGEPQGIRSGPTTHSPGLRRLAPPRRACGWPWGHQAAHGSILSFLCPPCWRLHSGWFSASSPHHTGQLRNLHGRSQVSAFSSIFETMLIHCCVE
jgi:hypothetical protein